MAKRRSTQAQDTDTLTERLRRHFFVPPPGTPPTWYRFFVYLSFTYPIGALGHGFFVLLFWYFDQPVLAWFNVGSAVLYAACVVGHRRGYFQLCFWPAGGEIMIHAALATAYVGWQSGFHFFYLVSLVGFFFAPFLSGRWKIAGALYVAALIGATYAYTLTSPPWRPLAEDAVVACQAINLFLLTVILSISVYAYANAAERAEAALEREKQRSEELLHNVMPVEIADRLKEDPSAIAQGYNGVTILFADIVGFTELSARSKPRELVDMLNAVFTRFDELTDKHKLEKIKTIGDAYMVVGGLPRRRKDHAGAVADLALEMMEAAHTIKDHELEIRIGINSGPAVAGVIGRKKFAYDLWGDSVNTAARMESEGVPGRIQVTKATRDLLKGKFALTRRGPIEVKGKGRVETWFLDGRK